DQPLLGFSSCRCPAGGAARTRRRPESGPGGSMRPFSVRCDGCGSVPEVGPDAPFLSRWCDTPLAASHTPRSVREGAPAGRLEPTIARPATPACPSCGRLDGAALGRGVRARENNAERRFLTGLGVVCLGGAALLSYAADSVLRFEAGRAGGIRALPPELLLFVAACGLFWLG